MWIGCSIALSACLGIWSAEPFHRYLTSRSHEVDTSATHVLSSEATPDCPTRWSVHKRRLHGGKQDGVDIVVINNGAMEIVVVPTRGMGIWSVKSGKVRLGWDSPVQEIVHPQFVSLPSRGGLGWLDGFGEWMCRCGLENNGHPGQDVIRDNTGASSTVDLTLHGKQAYLPAGEVELFVEREAPYTIRLRGKIDERMMHGPKFALETELALTPGETSFRIEDKVTNASALESEYQLLYHCNFGSPLLEEGSRLLVSPKSVTPFNDRAAEGDIREYGKFSAPQAGFVEQVYCLVPHANEKGETILGIANNDATLAATMTYQTKTLPYLTLWKNTAAREDGYVVGIEPGTNYPYNRRLERSAGRVPKLAGGESVSFTMVIEVHEGADAVARAIKRVEGVRQGRPTEYASKPNPPRELKEGR